MGFLDSLDHAYKWVDGLIKNTAHSVEDSIPGKIDDRALGTVGKAAALSAGMVPGLVTDIARLVPGEQFKSSHWDDDLGTKQTFGRLGSLLYGESTLTGWAIKGSIKELNKAWEAVDTAAQVPVYYLTNGLDYSQALTTAKQRSIGQTSVLAAHGMRNMAQSALGDTAGGLLADAYLTAMPGGNLLNIGSQDSFDGQHDDNQVDWLQPDAWDKLKDQNAAANTVAGALDVGATFAADPSLLALKAGGAFRAAGKAKEVFKETQWDRAFGKLVDTGKVHAQTDMSGELVNALPEKNFHPGLLDQATSENEVMAMFNLSRNHPMGGLVGKMLYKTNDIADPVRRINARRAIAGLVHGDPRAALDLVDYAPDLGYKLVNASEGTSGLNIFDAFAYDFAHAMDLNRGALRAALQPESVLSVTDQLMTEPSFVAMATSMARPAVQRTGLIDTLARKARGVEDGAQQTIFEVTASGKRALARERSQGLGRDGTLVTGHDTIDRIARRLPTTGVFAADSFTPAAMIVRGDFKEITRDDVAHLFGGTVGLVSGVRPVAKALAKASDALRQPRVFGLLNTHDAQVSVAVAKHLAHEGGFSPERQSALVSEVINAPNEAVRAIKIKKVRDSAIANLAEMYGVDKDVVLDLSQHGTQYAHAMRTAKNGERYSAAASDVPERLADGTPRWMDKDGNALNQVGEVIPDDDMALVFVGGHAGAHPITETQEVNSVEVYDIARARKWLERDHHLHAFSHWKANRVEREGNPEWARQIREGIAHRGIALGSNEFIAAKMETADRLNSFWKRNILLMRAGSFAIRNTLEEMLRVHALGYASAAATQRRISDQYFTKTGKIKDRVPAELQQALDAQRAHVKTLADDLNDPELMARAQAHREYAGGLDAPDGDLERFMELERVHAEAKAQLDYLEGLAKDARPFALRSQITLADGTKYEFGQAYADPHGKAMWDLQRVGGGQFDRDALDSSLKGIAEHQRRLMIDDSPYLNIADGGETPEYVDNYWREYSRILNLQIRQSKPAMIAVRAKAEGASEDEIREAVESWLRGNSAAAKNVRRANPVYRGDIDVWARDIANHVDHLVTDKDFAHSLLSGDISHADLAERFAGRLDESPRIHRASGSMIMGVQGALSQRRASKMFQWLDEASLQRWTRHPMYSAYYEDAMARKVKTWHEMVVRTRGEDARISSDEMNQLSEYARREAGHRIKNTFYNTNVRSSAAHSLRFIYPFFAAHQDSVRFWGHAIGDDPAVLRKLELGFSAPTNMGIVIDQNGAPLKPGDPVNPLTDSIAVQLPSFLGGKFSFPLNSWMLMLQSGSVLNPGAGPMVSVPVSMFSTQLRSMDTDVQRALKFIQPYGAPKDDSIWAGVAPTPLKRITDLVSAEMDNHSRAYTELLAKRSVDAHVKFLEEHGREETPQEWGKIQEKQAAIVKGAMMFRVLASVVSPSQPQPISEYNALIADYRRIQDKVRAEHGPAFSDVTEFCDKYGDVYFALTQSRAAMRGHVDPTVRAMAVLRDNAALRRQLKSMDSWGLIVGPEGGKDADGFSMNAYRAMQKLSGGPLDQDELFNKIRIGEGWQQYNRMIGLAKNQSAARGYQIPEDDPQFMADKKAIWAKVENDNDDWRIEVADFGRSASKFEQRFQDADTIAHYKPLLTDPGRSDIRYLREYVNARKYVQNVLDERAAAGGHGSMDAKDNVDVKVAFTRYVADLANRNAGFNDFVMPNLVRYDPFYDENLLGGNQ